MRSRVAERARELGLELEVKRLDASTRTVADAARAVGCEEDEIAKSIVFIVDGDAVVCIASGAHRVNPDLLCAALDGAEVRQATPEEVRAATGFAVGGVPPFGHELPVVLDEALLRRDRVWAAGGDSQSLFEVDPRVLKDCTGALVAVVGSDDR